MLLVQVRGVSTQPGTHKEGWPDIWRYSAGGRVGLALLGIAFTIATCIQLQGVLTRQWHMDYRWGNGMMLYRWAITCSIRCLTNVERTTAGCTHTAAIVSPLLCWYLNRPRA